MAIKPEALEKWLKDHSVDSRERGNHKVTERERRRADRRFELVEKLLSEPWGRELFHDIIANADVLKKNPMTGNAQSYYIMGLQEVAKNTLDWARRFHFKSYQLMEKEAHQREVEADNE